MAGILGELRTAGGCDVREATDDDAVAGVVPRLVASPGSTAETAALVTTAAAHGLTVIPRGTGSKLGWGAPPERVDLVIDTTRMDQVVEHAAGDLIVVVGAGRPILDLQADLAGSGQRLGIDPPRAGTIGGIVATGTTGPLRLFHGGVRDLVIGLRFVRADGVVAHSGGKVVKNVAGYDLGKLLTGSFGTLGVITEVAFRLHPVPAAQRWVTCPVNEPSDIQQKVSAVVAAQVAPSAVELDRDPAGGRLSVLIEGTGPGVAQRVAATRELLGEGATDSESPPPWWGREPGSGAGALLKVTHEIASLRPLLEALDETAAVAGLTAAFRGSPAVGTALVALDGDVTAERLAGVVSGMRERSAGFGGSIVVLDAPAPARADLDVWGPVSALELMQAVKHQFDPERRLAPGRFVGGI